MNNIESDFRQGLANFGLYTKDPIVADGKIHRFNVEGDKRGSKNGWYVLFDGTPPAGAFGSWKTGETIGWCLKDSPDISLAEQRELSRRIAEAQLARQIQEEIRYHEAKNKALLIWNNSLLAPNDHPYLVKKGVRNHGLKLYKNLLVIPLKNKNEEIQSLQFIDKDGNKRFLSGGRKKGYYMIIGAIKDVLCIAEGYATAASIYEATGNPCAVAFDAGNMIQVAKTLREKFSDLKIIICADNDEGTPDNPGMKKAKEAAIAVNALLATPGGYHA